MDKKGISHSEGCRKEGEGSGTTENGHHEAKEENDMDNAKDKNVSENQEQDDFFDNDGDNDDELEGSEDEEDDEEEEDEVDPFDINTNPLYILYDHVNNYENLCDVVQSKDLAEQITHGDAEMMLAEIFESRATFRRCNMFMSAFADAMSNLNSIVGNLTNLLTNKLGTEFTPYEPAEQEAADDLHKIAQRTQAHVAYASMTCDMIRLQELMHDIHESSVRVEEQLAVSNNEGRKLEHGMDQLNYRQSPCLERVDEDDEDAQNEKEEEEEDREREDQNEDTKTDKEQVQPSVRDQIIEGNEEGSEDNLQAESNHTEEREETTEEGTQNETDEKNENEQGNDEQDKSEQGNDNQGESERDKSEQNANEQNKEVNPEADEQPQDEAELKVTDDLKEDTVDTDEGGGNSDLDQQKYNYPMEHVQRNQEQAPDFHPGEDKGPQIQNPPERESMVQRQGPTVMEDSKGLQVLTFSTNQPDRDFEGGVLCVLRAKLNTIEKMQFDCSLVPHDELHYNVRENEDLISHVVSISTKGSPLVFENPVWVGIPRVAVKGQPHKQAVLMVYNDDGTWEELPAKDTVISNHKDIRFIETAFTSLSHLTLVAITRLKKQRETFNSRGGKLVSVVDPRVGVHVPRGAFRLSAEMSLKLLLVDVNALSDLKSRDDNCESIHSCSSVVYLNASSRPTKPLHLWVHNPSQGKKRPHSEMTRARPGSTPHDHGKPAKPKSAWTTGGKTKGGEHLHLLVRKSKGLWSLRDDIQLTCKRDIVHFEMQEVDTIDRLLLIRVTKEIDAAEVPELATKLESSLHRRVVNMIVRQRNNDLECAFMNCVRREKVERLMKRLKENGFTDGPDPGPDIILKEGEKVTVSLRGNITLQDELPKFSFYFHSYLNNARRQLYITEVDKFAQHGLDNYRGHVQFLSEHLREDSNNGNLLCELPVSLPKPPPEHASIKRVPIVINEKGAFTMDYLDLLSHRLGEEWKQLAEHLGVNKARIQSIIQYNAEVKAGMNLKNIKDMLVCWYKMSALTADKFTDLYNALLLVNRNDLAVDLYERNYEFQLAAEERATDERFKTAFKLVVDNSVALREWKSLGRHLGLFESDLDEIEVRSGKSFRQSCLTVLGRWRVLKGSRATFKRLVKVLRTMKLADLADKVKLIK